MIEFVRLDIRRLGLTLVTLLSAGIFTFVTGQVRVSPTPNPNPKFKALQPAQKFDAQLAKKALERGTSTIKGAVCSWSNGQVYWGTNVKVTLYPMTPYFEEWYNLREAKEDKNTAVLVSEEAVKYRIDTQTNGRAEFQFTEMKPGKYYIVALNEFTEYSSGSVYAGTARGSDGSSANIYRNQTYAADKKKRIEKIVAIDGEQQIEKVLLKSGFAGLIRLGTCGRK